MAHIPKEFRRKWDEKARSCLFLDYLEHTKGYRLYDEKTKKIFRSRDVIFYENAVSNAEKEEIIHMMSTKDDSENDGAVSMEDSSSDSEESFEMPDGRESELNPELEESQDTDDEIIELTDDNSLDHNSQMQEKQDIPTLRRSSRPAKPRDWSNYITYKVSVEPTGVEPINIQEALDFYSEEWGLAMKEEFDALMQNKTWELCPPPKGKKILKTRWVFKIKQNSRWISKVQGKISGKRL